MDREVFRHAAYHLLEKDEEVYMAVLREALLLNRSGGDIQRCEHCRRAMALVIVHHRPRASFLHRQAGLRAIQRLNLTFSSNEKTTAPSGGCKYGPALGPVVVIGGGCHWRPDADLGAGVRSGPARAPVLRCRVWIDPRRCRAMDVWDPADRALCLSGLQLGGRVAVLQMVALVVRSDRTDSCPIATRDSDDWDV